MASKAETAMWQSRAGVWAFRSGLAVLLALLMVPLGGCNNFFSCDKASCSTSSSGSSGSGSTGSSTSDFAYVAYTGAGSTSGTTVSTLAGFNIGSGALTPVGTLQLGYAPLAMAITPTNTYLYVASLPTASTPGIYGYSISSTGALTALNSGNPLVSEPLAALALSSDGAFLYGLDATDGITQLLVQFQVNSTTGALTSNGTVALTPTSCSTLLGTPAVRPCDLHAAPSGAFLSISLAGNGDQIFAYTAGSGLNSQIGFLIPTGSTTLNDFAGAWDKNNYFYLARTTQLAVYAVTTTAATQASFTNYPSGTQPRAVALSNGYGFVYTANPSASTISGYGIGANGALTAITGSPFVGPTNVAAFGVDNTGSYAVGVGYDASAGVQLFSVGTGGGLTVAASTGSTATTAYPVLLALTH